jgi:hypothetical protein
VHVGEVDPVVELGVTEDVAVTELDPAAVVLVELLSKVIDEDPG